LTKEEQAALEKEAAEKRKLDEAAAKMDEANQAKYSEQKEKDFDDLLSGKTQADSEKNLQTLFKEFYTKAKTESSKVDVKDYLNSARSSVGSLSSKLEQRRQKLAEKRKGFMDVDKASTEETKAEEQATDKTKSTTAEKVKEEEKKPEAESTDKSSTVEDPTEGE
jgi:hypothetical protein